MATIHDGWTRSADADLVVDGSVLAVRRAGRSRRPATPQFAILDYAVH